MRLSSFSAIAMTEIGGTASREGKRVEGMLFSLTQLRISGTARALFGIKNFPALAPPPREGSRRIAKPIRTPEMLAQPLTDSVPQGNLNNGNDGHKGGADLKNLLVQSNGFAV
ncbi:hypothetical protein LMG27198_47320 [Methylocystis echinoides]|uniref:Uncharacterized protein n=1 Tax=Methylocystis echinoides TaxID=29468 RepID=A0A9W6GZJ9_9HYPH|nr:hypothetical protein LMG27198_47320 [Methylocystis echinoides]